MKVLVDVNILLDVFLERAPFFERATEIWAAVEGKRVAGCVSSVTCTTIYYVARRHRGIAFAHEVVGKAIEAFEIAAVDDAVLTASWNSELADFEDAVQAYSGHAAGATHVVTRDKPGFEGGPLFPLSPEELISALPAERT
jgi:predicted nucleic acid-binding protein